MIIVPRAADNILLNIFSVAVLFSSVGIKIGDNRSSGSVGGSGGGGWGRVFLSPLKGGYFKLSVCLHSILLSFWVGVVNSRGVGVESHCIFVPVLPIIGFVRRGAVDEEKLKKSVNETWTYRD